MDQFVAVEDGPQPPQGLDGIQRAHLVLAEDSSSVHHRAKQGIMIGAVHVLAPMQINPAERRDVPSFLATIFEFEQAVGKNRKHWPGGRVGPLNGPALLEACRWRKSRP